MNKTLDREICRSSFLPVICTFNFLPFTYTHPSWLDKICPVPVIDTPGPRAIRSISQLILNRLDLADSPFWDFSVKQHRYGLLPPAILEKFSTYIGAAFSWKEISLIIDGRRIVQLRHEFGKELFTFITERAPMILPEKLCVTRQTETVQDCLEIGTSYLASILHNAPTALHKRISLKLPMGVWPLDHPGLTEKEQKAIAIVIEKILSFEVDSKWARSLQSFN